MFKYAAVLAMFLCVANAGIFGGHVASVAVAHGATSYQNNNLHSVHPVAIPVAHAPVVAHAPIAFAHAPHAVGFGHGYH